MKQKDPPNRFIQQLYTVVKRLKYRIDYERLDGVRKIAPEENCPPVRVKIWFRISLRIRAARNFPRGQFSQNPLDYCLITIFRESLEYSFHHFHLPCTRFISRRNFFKISNRRIIEETIIIKEETVKMSKTLHQENHYSWFTGLSKVAEVLGEINDFLASTVQREIAFRRILENHWYSSRVKYSQGKLRLYTTLKERPGFETYLTLSNPKLRQAITKLRISAHKLPIETGRYDQKTQTERICPLCCEGIGNVTHYIFEC